MSEIFNKAVEQADKLSTQDNARAVLDELYGKFEERPIAEQLALSVTPGIGNVISAGEVDIFGRRAGEAFEKDEYGKAAGYGALTGLAALGTLPGVGILGRGAKAAIRSGTKLLDEPVEKAIKEIGEKTEIPETTGLKALDEPDINSILKSDEALEQYGKDWKNVNRLSKSQRQKQKSKIKDAAKQFEEGTLTGKEFRNVVKSELPIKPINKMVDVPEFDEIIGALKPKQVKTGIVGLTKDLTGQRVATRLDIPSYDNYNKWIVSIHEGLKGPATGYAKSARLTDVVFGSSPKTGLKIAKGDINKSTIARMEGNWNNIADDDTISFAEQLLKRKKNGKYIDEVGEEWIQVGMNPYRASYFYDKATGQALQAAEEVIQVGPLVFARGARKPTLSEYKKGFTVQTGKGKKIFKQGGQIATGLAGLGENIVYRQDGGEIDEAQFDYTGADIVGGAFTDYAGVERGGFADVPIGVDPGQRTDDKGGLRDPTTTELVSGKGVTGNPRNIDGGNLVAFADKLTEQTGIEVVPFYDAIFNSRAGRIALDAMLNRGTEDNPVVRENSWDAYSLNTGYNDDDLSTIQAAIDNGDLQGMGIEFANAMEAEGLNTFGKNMRSSMEAWTPGKGLSRDKYDPGILTGTAKYTDVASERKKALAAEEFTGMLTDAERGETVGDIYMKYEQRYGTKPPADLFGYIFGKNSNAQARDVAASLDEARSKGALQGLSMMLGFGMTTIPNIVSSGYTLDKGITKTDNVHSRAMTQLKEAVSPLLPDFLTDKKTVDLSNLPSEAYIPYGKEEEIDESLLEQVGGKIGEIAGYAEWLTNPVEKGLQSLLNWGGENLSLKSVPDYMLDRDAAVEQWKSIREDPTLRDRIRDFLPDFGKRPLSSSDVSGGENITEVIQSPSIETAALPVAEEEDKSNIYSTMASHFSQPKPLKQNPFRQALLTNIYGPNTLLT